MIDFISIPLQGKQFSISSYSGKEEGSPACVLFMLPSKRLVGTSFFFPDIV